MNLSGITVLPHPSRVPLVLGAGLLAMLVLFAGLSARGLAGPAQVSGSTAHYSAGWNLVAAPTGSVLDKALPPYYAYGPTGSDYMVVRPGEIVGGRGVWAYFPTDTDVVLGSTASDSTRVQAPADRWVMLGDPSTTKTLAIQGADAAVGYSAAQGYFTVASVQPGQGVWVLRHTAGEISLANSADNGFEQRVRGLQIALTADPTGQLSYDQATQLGSEMVAARDYADVQAASDDLLSAVEDGLQENGAAPLPALSSVQEEANVSVREAIARAEFASASGDNAGADGLVEQAKKSAKSSEDDGVSLARGNGAAAILYTSATGRAAATPANLSAFGALIRSGVLSITLGQPVGADFWNVGNALLAGQPVPPAPGQSNPPVNNPPVTNPIIPTPTPTPAVAACAGATGLGLSPLGGFPGTTIFFSATGFTPNQVGVLTLQGTLVTTIPIGSDCTAGGSFVIPNLPPGPYLVSFQTPKDGAATAFLQVLQAPQPTPTPRPVCNPQFSRCPR